jgi:segregation and condensation protein B
MLAAPPTAPVDMLEALLFASDAPLEPERIREVLGVADVAEARALVDELRARLESGGRALQITEVAGGYRMVTRPEMAPWLVRLARSRTRARLSRPAIETLAIIAYRQPVSRPEIDAIRGVNSEGVLDSLMERRLVRIAGRKEAPGRPFIYETTREFLVAFGLRDVGELPRVEGELIVPDAGGDTPAAAATEATGDPAAEPVTDVDAGEIAAAAQDVRAASDEDSAVDGAAEGTVTAADDTVANAAETVTTAEAADVDDQVEQAPRPGGPHVETGR